jgi:cysteine synthase A
VSDLLDHDLLDSVETVALDDAEAACRRLAREEGVLVGQSSGATYLAAERVAERIAEPQLNCPDVDFDADTLTDAELDDDALLDSGPDSADRASTIRSDGGDAYDDCPLVVTVFPDSGERYLSAGVFD